MIVVVICLGVNGSAGECEHSSPDVNIAARIRAGTTTEREHGSRTLRDGARPVGLRRGGAQSVTGGSTAISEIVTKPLLNAVMSSGGSSSVEVQS